MDVRLIYRVSKEGGWGKEMAEATRLMIDVVGGFYDGPALKGYKIKNDFISCKKETDV